MKRIYDYSFSKYIITILCGLALFVAPTSDVSAQYFGQNKMRYKKLDFKVYDTPHFNIYYYLENERMMKWLAQESEVWYEMHQQVFQDTFVRKNPIVFYSNHPEFQQTTTVQGEIGASTGGVTEAFKQRVVMPVMLLNHQTRHVLGHELVHAFQFRVLMEGSDSTRLENIANLPLWMVEGMAEYFSIGKKDAFTSMWMRDAYARNDFPSLRQLTEQSYQYFPYRYGQSFLAFIGATYGDTVIMPMFIETAKYGYEMAMRRVFGYDAQTISTLWKNSMESTYRNLGKDTTSRPIGTPILTTSNAGRMNVSPAISPDGKYVAFLSELDLFSIDLFLADAQTGQVIRKLSSRLRSSDIEDFSFIESAGTFSPDSRRFAFSVFSGGKNKLMIVDTERGRRLDLIEIGDIEQFSNITWAPNGELVAFSGLRNGHSDIYTYNLKTKELVQLMNDYYSDFQPSFSRDGKHIVFSTDRVALQSDNKSVDIPLNLAVINLATKEINNLDVFPGANNLNAQFSGSGEEIYFLSNRDGFRNMYRYVIATRQIEQMTDFFTGISGITEYSPALSISADDQIVYSYYKNNSYSVYRANKSDFEPQTVEAGNVNFDAAMLPPPVARGVNVVNTNLTNFNLYQRIDTSQIQNIAYRPQFKLDYLANTGVGMSVGNRFGAGMAGGVFGIFSDILGYNQIYAALNINGEIYDFGGQVAYINQRSRWNWGGALSHTPFMYGFSSFENEDFGRGGLEPSINTYIIRQFQTQLEGFVAYPFNRHHRFEVGASIARYGLRAEKWRQSAYGGFVDRQRISNEEAAMGIPGLGGQTDPFFLHQVNTGFVGDNAVFGIAAPLQGFRYRLSAGQNLGTFNFRTYNVDYRRYERIKPITLAARVYSYIRAGEGENAFQNLYLGYPWLLRGFEVTQLGRGLTETDRNRLLRQSDAISVNDLMGSRMAIANFEVRLPFTGPERLAAFKSGFLFSDLNLFFDAGAVWGQGRTLKWKRTADDILEEIGQDQNGNPATYYSFDPNVSIPVFSLGVSMRINLFGAMILEPYYAIPLNPGREKFGHFGLNFAPGW